ncbi:MAG: PDZ domain-containing protein [Planctomycetota bacterium]
MPLFLIDTASVTSMALRSAGALAVSAGLAFACPASSKPCAQPAPPAPAAPSAFPVLPSAPAAPSAFPAAPSAFPAAPSAPAAPAWPARVSSPAPMLPVVWTAAAPKNKSIVTAEWLEGPIHVPGARTVTKHRTVDGDKVIVIIELESQKGDEAELVWLNDEFSGELNGETLTYDRLVRSEDGNVFITDGSGKNVFELMTHASPRITAEARFAEVIEDGRGARFTVRERQSGRQAQAERERRIAEIEARVVEGVRVEPRVVEGVRTNPPRIGINFTEPGRTLARQLGIDSDEAVVISGIAEGFPAQRAGLKENDIIIRIGDEKTGGERAIRKVLASKQPGDKVEVIVLRGGEKKSYTLKLNGALARGERLPPRAPQPPAQWFNDDDNDVKLRLNLQRSDEIERVIAESLAEAERAVAEAMSEDGAARRELEAAMKALEMARVQSADSIARLHRFGAGQSGALIGRLNNNADDDDNTFFFRSPLTDASELAEDLDERLEDLEDSIDDRFDDLESQIEDLHDHLEEMSDRLAELLDRMESH